MRFFLLGFVLVAQPLLAQQGSSDAYHDDRARELVQLARQRRQFVDRSISAYQATAKERISVGLRLGLRERLLYRRETASRIEWQRGGPINIKALGAREVVPIAMAKAQVPDDLDQFLPRLAFDPMDREGLMRIDTTVLRDPLSDGAEAHYRYRIGGTTTIRLSDRSIKLLELRVEPRRRDVHLMSGSFWIDDATHSVVQVVFRLAKDYDFEILRGDDEDVVALDRGADSVLVRDSVYKRRRDMRGMPLPGFMKPIRAELQYVTLEYGLMELRWWMPRLIAAEGIFQMGAIRTPMHYERSYSYDQVTGDTAAALTARSELAADSSANRRCRPNSSMSVNVEIGGEGEYSDRYRERREKRIERRNAWIDSLEARGDTARVRRMREADACARQLYRVTIADSVDLLRSSDLPESIYGDLAELTGEAELSKLAEQLKDLLPPPWLLQRPSLSWGLGGNGLVRYNKIEGLAVGGRGEFDFGRLRADATAHFGTADLQPKLELGITRGTPQSLTRLGLYRRLSVMDQAAGFGGLSASLNALVLGEDDRDYYRATGIELSRRPGETNRQWYELKLFAEQQRAVSRHTNFSIAHVINERDIFQPNLIADRANQAGGELTLRAFGGQNPAGFRWSAELRGLASAGTFDFTRESALLQIGFPLPFRFVGALEAAAGTTTGPVPEQSLWYLGGAHTLRGYDIGEVSGSAFWRGRAELGTAFPGARLVGFTDLGWAGDRNQIADRASLLSVGAGASFLDGILRFDLARALRGNRGWKFHVSVNGVL